MEVILTLKGVRNPQDHKKTATILLIIKLKRASDERVGGPPGANILDSSGGVMAPGSKSLASVEYISGSCGGGWRQFVGPRCCNTQNNYINECFGCVTIVKTIHYRILECTRILHVFWNVELRYKHFEKPALMPSMPQLFVTNT